MKERYSARIKKHFSSKRITVANMVLRIFQLNYCSQVHYKNNDSLQNPKYDLVNRACSNNQKTAQGT